MKINNLIIATACALLSTTALAQNFTVYHNGAVVGQYDIAEGDSIVFSDSPSIGGHEYVDLGLSVKWAICNIGAYAPEEVGNFYAWGETQTKDFADYDIAHYKWLTDNTKNHVTKYCSATKYWYGEGDPDSLKVLLPEDDAATANWGNEWRMPTIEEQMELVNNCTWEWQEKNDELGLVDGYKVTGPNGKSIFLPATGCHTNESTLTIHGLDAISPNYGFYWSSSVIPGGDYCAYYLNISKTNKQKKTNNVRYYGMVVRPVHE